MKVKVLVRNPDDYLRETKHDVHKVPRNYAAELHPFQEAREYVRALNATKLERVFAKPFVASLDGHGDGVHCLAKHPQRLSLALSGACDGQLRVWNLPRTACVSTLQAHSGYVRGICVDPANGDSFVTVGDDQQLKCWSLDEDGAAADVPVRVAQSESALSDVTHHWRRPLVATCGGDGVHVWDRGRSAPVRHFDWGVESVQRVRFGPVETDLLLAAAVDRSLILYDSRAQQPLRKVLLKLRSNAVAWNPMEAYTFTAANEDYNLYTFDMRNLKAPTNVHMDHVSAVMDVDYSPTGREFVSGSYDKTVRIFAVDAGRSREVYHTKRMQRVMCVLWSMDDKFVLNGSDEMNVRVWKARAAEKLGPVRWREQRALRYADRLKQQYGQHPDVRRIARHRHVPKHIYNAHQEQRTIHQSQKRKEANRRAHSRPGAVPHVPERRRHVVSEQT